MVPLDAKIRVKFSERVAQKSVLNAFSISPPLKTEPRVKVRSDELQISPAANLEPDRTYVVSIGSSLTDLNGNKLASSLAFAFSTGHRIDSASVMGIVYNQQRPEPNFRVFAYEMKPWLFDSLFAVMPEYITETGRDGKFNLQYMRAGEYLVLGVEDKDRDNKINGQSERLAFPIRPAVASQVVDSLNLYPLYMTRFDSLNFALINCRGTAGAVTMQFSGGKLDASRVSRDSISIRSSTGATFAPLTVMNFVPETDKLHLWSDSLLPDSSYHITIIGMVSLEGRHLAGDTASCDVRLRELDKEKPSIISRTPPDTRSIILPAETLAVVFSEPMTIQPNAASIIVDTALTLSLRSVLHEGTEYQFIPADTLPQNRKLKFVLHNRMVADLYGNSPADSLYMFEFTVGSPDSLGTLTGTIESDDTVTIILNGIVRKLQYTFLHQGTAPYRWELYPDSYTLYSYADKNHNHRWDLGSLIPFTYAEPAWIEADTIKIRARFEREGFDLKIK